MALIERRRLLVLAGGALAAGGCEYDSDPATGIVAAGSVNDLPEGTMRVVEGEPVAVARDAGGVYALSLICQHSGCDMSDDSEVSFAGITCDCHGSRYDANGGVVEGPTEDPLDHFQVSIDAGGAVTVNADVIVDASVRVPVE